jgi:hypothetical protein
LSGYNVKERGRFGDKYAELKLKLIYGKCDVNYVTQDRVQMQAFVVPIIIPITE